MGSTFLCMVAPLFGFHNANNTTISNCNFGFTSNPISYNIIGIDGSSTGTVIKYNTIDGGGLAQAGTGTPETTIALNAPGTLDVEYNWMKNLSEDVIQTNFSGTSSDIEIKYNLIENNGETAGAHPDWTQFGGGTYSNINILYNTTYMSTSGSDGWWLLGGSIQSFEIAFNTLITAKGGSLNSAFAISTPHNFTALHGGPVKGPGTIHDNYVDPTTLNGRALAYRGSVYEGVDQFYDNFNMLNGARFPDRY